MLFPVLGVQIGLPEARVDLQSLFQSVFEQDLSEASS